MLGAALLLAAPPADAQTARTITVTAAITSPTVSGGDRDTSTDGLQVNEGDVVTITYTIDGVTSGTILLEGVCPGGTATGGDYSTGQTATGCSKPATSALVFESPNRLVRTSVINITQDTAAEGDKTIILSSFVTTGSDTVTFSPASITITILRNDGATSEASLGGADASVSEGMTVNVPVELAGMGARTADSAVAFSITAGSGTLTSDDYTVDASSSAITFNTTAGTGSITIAAADTSGNIPIAIVADSADDDGEMLIVTLTGHTNANIATTFDSAARTYTLRDSVRTLTVTGPATITEGMPEDFTVTLTGTAFSADTTVTWAVDAGATNPASAADFPGNALPTGTVTFGASDGNGATKTFAITAAADSLVETGAPETFTVQVSVTDRTADGGTRYGMAASATITDNDTAGLVVSATALEVPEGDSAQYSVRLMTQPSSGTVTVTIGGGGNLVSIDRAELTFDMNDWDMPETVTVTAAADATAGAMVPAITHTVGGTATEYGSAANVSVTVTIVQADDPEMRTARVTTQLAGFAKAATQLTAQAVSQRLNFSGANTFNLGQADTAEDILRQSSFSLAHGNGGINLWASGNRSNASGTDDSGVTYDGDATALQLGADTTWNDGLLGIAVSQSSGDTDFKAGGINSKLESSVVTLHPYLTRKVDDLQLWATIGYGTGEAKLQETENNVRYDGDADLSLLSAAAGMSLAVGDNASFTAAAHWSKTEWDAATLTEAGGTGTRMLPKGDASTLRLDGGAELGKRFGDWRPFLTVNIRRDSGDGDDGNAADYGGGLEWQSSNVHLRLAGRKHAQGRGPDEEHLTFTARKTSGKLNLGLNLSADDGINTGNLLTGELRF